MMMKKNRGVHTPRPVCRWCRGSWLPAQARFFAAMEPDRTTFMPRTHAVVDRHRRPLPPHSHGMQRRSALRRMLCTRAHTLDEPDDRRRDESLPVFVVSRGAWFVDTGPRRPTDRLTACMPGLFRRFVSYGNSACRHRLLCAPSCSATTVCRTAFLRRHAHLLGI